MIVVTGSIATDHLMTYRGRFAEQLLAESLDRLSVSFLVDDLEIRYGGTGANIAFGMARLGLRPLLVGAAGADFAPYRQRLEAAGVDTAAVRVSASRHTARFVCTTDTDQNQIASFYAGAMTEAAEIELPAGPDLVVVSPNAPAAMLRHTRECRERGVPFAADPSQQLASLSGAQIRELVEGATYLLGNEYEKALIESKTGWTPPDILRRTAVRVTTYGAAGVAIEQPDGAPIRVPAVPGARVVEPTGLGDAFRAGLLAARSWGLGLERSAQVGSVLATFVLETVGTQEYALTAASFLDRLAMAYGVDAAAEVEPHLPA